MITTIHRQPASTLFEVTFDLGGFSPIGRRMIVTGSFCEWRTSRTGARCGFIQTYHHDNTVTLTLPAGRHEYKYYDQANAEWMEVERYPDIYRGYYWDFVRNPFGTMNCMVALEPSARPGLDPT